MLIDLRHLLSNLRRSPASAVAAVLTLSLRSVTYPTFEAWRERAGSLAAMEASDGTHLTLTERSSGDDRS